MVAARDRHRGAGRAAASHLVFGFASPAVLEQRGPLTLVKGRGVYVWDAAGRKYLDGLASLWNVAVGHGRTEIARAVAAQIRAIEFAPALLGFASLPAQQLAARLARLAPPGLTRVLFTSGGSEANESVIRLVRVYWRLRGRPEKFRMVTLTRAYHGSTMGAATLTGLPYFHTYYDPLLPGVLRIPRPFCARCELGKSYPGCGLACADELQRLIEREGAERVGAVIIEPVQGVGGVIVPPPGYLERLRSICSRYDVLLVADEVITGFGRLGTAFGIQRWKVIPDMIAFAKGVSSGYLPLGGVILQQRIYKTLIDAGPQFSLHHGFTYSGHPVACAAALANLEIMAREQLFRRVRSLAPHFARRLRALKRQPIVGEVRAIGLMGAIDLVRDRDRNEPFPPEVGVPLRVREAALSRGVIVRASADGIVLCPPFVITPPQIDHLTTTLDKACGTVARALRDEGLF